MKLKNAVILLFTIVFYPIATSNAEMAFNRYDVHIHYSHDAWERITPEEAIEKLKAAGIKKAFVSSSSDEGTQRLYNASPDFVIPVLRPYRKRGELNSWYKDLTVVDMLRERLSKNKYAGIGEFHVSGKNADSDVVKGLVKLAMENKIFMHAHSDADAISRIFKQAPTAKILWAHGGFEELSYIIDMLRKHDQLYVDLAYRSEYADGPHVDEAWFEAFQEFPNRFMLGTDTYTPETWSYIGEQAEWDDAWLKNIPQDLAEKISWKNASALADWAYYNR